MAQQSPSKRKPRPTGVETFRLIRSGSNTWAYETWVDGVLVETAPDDIQEIVAGKLMSRMYQKAIKEDEGA